MTGFVCLVAISLSSAAWAQEKTAQDPTKQIRAWLEDHSWIVTPKTEDTEQHIKTNIEKYAGGKLMLNYEFREVKAGELVREQFITYKFDPNSMARNSINIIKLPSKPDKPDMWMIEARLKEDVPLIEYNNFFADYAEDGTEDSSNSRGKSKNIIFGYTLNLEDARILGELVKDLISVS